MEAGSAAVKEFGAYDLIGEIGRGGMGVVYRAMHRSLRRPCALKTIHVRSRDLTDVARFIREGQAIARLGKHSYIAQVFDAGVVDGVPYMAMELIEGESLETRVSRGGPLPEAEVLELGRKIALALDHAHRRGIVHRDVKPANIVIGKDGEPQLLDFGIAHDLLGRGATPPIDGDAEESGMVGTPSFMSPEQADPRGRTPDARSDVFSLGGTMYAAVTGQKPFESRFIPELLVKLITQDPPRPSSLAPVSPDLEAILRKCLEKSPGSRYQTALELADDCSRVATGLPARARPAGPLGRMLRWARRHPELAVVGSALVIFAVVAAAYFAYRAREVEALWTSISQRTGRAAAQEVRSLLDPAVPLLEECAALAEADLMPVDDGEALARHLVARFRYRKSLNWLSYGDEKARFTGAWRDAKGRIIVNRSWLDREGEGHLREYYADTDEVIRAKEWSYDPRTRPFYKLATGSTSVAWTPPYDWYDGEGLGITACLALRKETGEPRGVFTADFRLDSLARFLGGLSLGARGRAYLLARDGALIAAPEVTQRAPDPLLVAAIGALKGGIRGLPTDETVALRFDSADVSYVAAVGAYQAADNLEVVTAVIVPESEVTGQLVLAARQTARLTAFVAAAALLGAVAVSTMRYRRLIGAVAHRPRPAARPPQEGDRIP